jgi:Predicted methyltransferase
LSGPISPDFDRFIVANTEIAVPPLVPEIRLRLATEIVPIWQATEVVLAELNIPPPFWAFCWPGGQALARHILDHPESFVGKRILDFAAGSGVVAIAAALAGAHACANDVDAMALAAIGINAGLNGVRVDPIGRNLLTASSDCWDVVLAGDVCYERGLADRIWVWLRKQAANGAVVLLGDPGRTYLPSVGLEAIARYLVPTSMELEDGELKETTVWRVI